MTTLIPKFDFMNGGTTPVGAVNRTINNKLADTVSLFDFIPVSEQAALLDWTSSYDCTSAFNNAIAFLKTGGTLTIPPIRAKITDEIALTSGIRIAGSSNVAHYYGGPTGNEKPTYIWQATESKSVFTILAGVSTVYHDIYIHDVALASALTPPTMASGFAPSTTKDGLHMTANTPYNTHDVILERVTFYGFRRGISAEDLGTSTFNGNIGPVTLNNCEFYSNLIGVFLNDDNDDGWIYNNCTFYISQNGSGVLIAKGGFQTFNSCISGAWAGYTTNTVFLRITGPTYDCIKLNQCQGESLSGFLSVEADSGAPGYVPITLDGCAVEADIALGGSCHFISIASRYNKNVYITANNVTIDSYVDTWSTSTLGFQFNAGLTGSYINSATVPGSYRSAGLPFNVAYGRKIGFGTTTPSTGTWTTGDVINRFPPVVGQPIAWSCTVGGTPGTWVAQVNL